MLSLPHLIIIFVVALLIFGPEKLPELARKMGKISAELRRASATLRGSLDEGLRELEREVQQTKPQPWAAGPALPESPAVPAAPSPAPTATPDGSNSSEKPADGHTTPA